MFRNSILCCFILFSAYATAIQRTFTIDYENNQFLKDNEPFRYISGSLHYFRLPSAYWRDRLHKMRMAGLNAVSTYVEWRSHERVPGTFDFSGEQDLERFLSLAAEEGLYVLLRPGPYICAERDMGGLPSWLLSKNPDIELRSNDATYMSYVHRWITILMTRIAPFLYGNGGPIIMVQVENEYGSYSACDRDYTTMLKEILESHVGTAAVLYTTDGNSDGFLRCGKIPGVYATVDFGTSADVNASFAAMRKFEPRGPLVNSEFYPGWLDHWGEPHNEVRASAVVRTLEEILQTGASVNFYMFFGGTNFGFTAVLLTYQGLRLISGLCAGADITDSVVKQVHNNDLFDDQGTKFFGANLGSDQYSPQPTSYDYDAPLSEAGDPTAKYSAIRDVIAKYLPLPPGPPPRPAPKGDYGLVNMTRSVSIFEMMRLFEPIKSKYPLTFEQLDQWGGFVLYQTEVVRCPSDPVILSIPKLHDRAYVFINRNFAGILSRMHKIYSLPVVTAPGDEVSILVENQGRVNYGSGLKDFKGILSNVTLGNNVLEFWSMYRFPLDSNGLELTSLDRLTSRNDLEKLPLFPAFYHGHFRLQPEVTSDPPPDTFLDLKGWFKGVAFVNGFNLGRYWSAAGPQRTLYLPGSLLVRAPARNRLVLLELERSPLQCAHVNSSGCVVRLRSDPVLDTTGCGLATGQNRRG